MSVTTASGQVTMLSIRPYRFFPEAVARALVVYRPKGILQVVSDNG